MFEDASPGKLVGVIADSYRQESILIARRLAAVAELLGHRIAEVEAVDPDPGYSMTNGFQRTSAEVAAAMNMSPMGYVSPAVAADLVWAIPQQHSLFVLRQDASVQTDSSVFFTSDRVAVRATLRVSFGFTYPLAIVKITKT